MLADFCVRSQKGRHGSKTCVRTALTLGSACGAILFGVRNAAEGARGEQERGEGEGDVEEEGERRQARRLAAHVQLPVDGGADDLG